LIKKLEKWSTQSSAKDLESEDSEKVSIHIEAYDNEKQPKKGVMPKNAKSSESMTVEQIQDFIANAVKAQLSEGSRRTHIYTMPYTKRVDAVRMSHSYQPRKSQ